MVSLDDEGGLGLDEVGPPVFQCFDDCQEFLFVDVILLFCWSESSGVVCDQVVFGF